MGKLNLSGHETFHCRHLWLKKGYDFVLGNKKFSDPYSVVDLGVGKNMVSSISYWMKAFGLVQRDGGLSKIANFIFGKNGVDPYLEDTSSLWLLHYHLVTENVASIYSIVFNEFRKKRFEFTKRHLTQFIKYKCEETNTQYNEKTVERDISVFIRNYVRPEKTNKNIEDLFSGLFIELDLITKMRRYDEEESVWYAIENRDRNNLNPEVILYCILSTPGITNSVTVDELLYEYSSIGNVFAISAKDLLEKIDALCKRYKSINFTDDGGIKLLQIKQNLDKWKVLKKYYEK